MAECSILGNVISKHERYNVHIEIIFSFMPMFNKHSRNACNFTLYQRGKKHTEISVHCIFNSPCSVKLNKGGSSLPYGSRVFVSRSSSKKVWAQAWSGEIRDEGVYSSSRDTRSIASGGVRARNTCHQYRQIYIHIA